MIYRQGDVLIVRTDHSTDGFTEVLRENGRVVLAHGEATGHAHAIKTPDARLFMEDGGGRGLLHVPSGADVVHEEHKTIALPPGLYEVRRQREFDAGAVRRVAD